MKNQIEKSSNSQSGSPGLLRLVVHQRSGDFHVQLEKDATMFDCGRTYNEAIGRWITAHGKEYGIEVLEANKPTDGCVSTTPTKTKNDPNS